jgi:RNA polymerase sigma-70 factor (ECF subfamily)
MEGAARGALSMLLGEVGQVAVTDKELTEENGPALEDRYLAKAFQAGDPSSYRLIHQRYRAEVEALCRRMLGNFHDAEEATQETFIRVYQALPRFNGQYRLRPWIAKIATNVCLDMLRTRTRAKRLELNGNGNGNGHANGNGNGHGHFPTTEEWAEYHANGNGHVNGDLLDPLEILERRSESGEVRAALATLPDHYRMALLMREYEGFSHEEIGAVLGMSTSQVKALLHRAKKSFRRVWTNAATRSFGLVLPLLGWLRRLGRRAVEVSQPVATGAAASSQAASSVVSSVAASPVTASMAERVVGVLAAVTVTGAIGVGAVTATHHHASPARKAPAVVASLLPPPAAPAVKHHRATVVPAVPVTNEKATVLPTSPNVILSPSPAPSTASNAQTPPPTPGPTEGSPATEPSPSDSGTPTPDPSGTPAAQPSPSPATVVVLPPLPPDWGGSFKVSFAGGDLCVCDGLHMTPMSSSGTPGKDFRFVQQLTGTGSLGGDTWNVAVTVAASIPGPDRDGFVKLVFTLTAADGSRYRYDGTGTMTAYPGGPSDGIWTYSLNGSWVSGPDLGQSGDFHGLARWWTDGADDNRPVESTMLLTQAV